MNTYLPMTAKARELSGSRKKQFRFSEGPDVVNVDSYWDGGSRSSFAVLNINTGLEVLPQGNAPFGAHGRLGYKLVPGDVVIETGTFCGKPATPCFMCRVDDASRVLDFLGVAHSVTDETDASDDTNCERRGNAMNLDVI